MNSPTTKRWWLAVNGRADGPRTATFINAALQSGQIDSTTEVCPEGGAEWIPLTACSEFACTSTNGSAPLIPRSPSPSVVHSAAHDNLVTNAAFPQMANWICMFVIVFLPLYWVFGALASIAMLGPTELEFAFTLYGLLFRGPITLALTIALAISGLRLRDLRASGLRFLKFSLLADVGFAVVNLLLSIILAVVITMRSGAEAEPSGLAMFFDVVLTFIGVVSFAFEIIAFLWLQKHETSLPLDPRR